MRIAYTHGRYQPIHNGHFLTMLHILENYNQLWIGIANPLLCYPPLLDPTNNDLVKSIQRARDSKNNPYSFLERLEMILDSFIVYGIDIKRIKVLPHFAFYDIPTWYNFIPDPSRTDIILSSKDYHHYEKIKIYKSLGWNVAFIEKVEGISGEVFDTFFPNGNWRSLVPEGAIPHIEKKIIV
jgi:hypothetical protein